MNANFLKPQKIFLKIVSLMIIVSVLPIVTLAFFLNRASVKSIQESVSSGFENISQRAANESYIFIKGTENILKSTSEIVATLYSDDWKTKLILRNLAQNLDGIESISFINEEGEAIVSSDIEKSKTNYSTKDFFKKTITGNSFYSKIYISDTLMPTMTISVPVEKTGKRLGVLVAVVAVRHLWELVDSIKIGQTGHAYIVDKDGMFIAHPQRDKVIKHEKFKQIPIIEKLLHGVSSTSEYINESGIRVVGAVAIVPTLGWGVVVEQSVEEAFALTSKIYYFTIFLVIIAIVFSITVGFLRTVKITAPIKELTEGARKIAQGNLSYLINVKNEDEIGELANNFNKMTVGLKTAQEQLIQNERLAVLGRLSSKVAHEVRNPLEAVKGAAVFLNNKYNKDKSIQKFTEIIIQEVNQLGSFISMVLVASKKIEVQPILTNVNMLLENIDQLLVKDTRFTRIKLTKQFDKNIPNCLVDPEHLRRAILNILINAMQAMPKGGEITIGTKYVNSPEEYIEITVQDNGRGIPANVKDDIFKPFVTTRRTGTGLGLSYVYDTITQHQGKVTVASELNKGSKFIICLPVIESNKT